MSTGEEDRIQVTLTEEEWAGVHKLASATMDRAAEKGEEEALEALKEILGSREYVETANRGLRKLARQVFPKDYARSA